MREKKAVIFDLDDTLYYERDYVYQALEEVAAYLAEKFQKNSIQLWEQMCDLLEKEGRGHIFNRICEIHQIQEDIQKLVMIYRNTTPNLTLYKDAQKCLDRLKKQGIKTGLITDGCFLVQRKKVEALALYKQIDKIIITDEKGLKYWKPSIQPYQDILKQLQVNPEDAVYIGDNPKKDFIGAKTIGMDTIRIIRAVGDHILDKISKELEADQIIYTLDDI